MRRSTSSRARTTARSRARRSPTTRSPAPSPSCATASPTTSRPRSTSASRTSRTAASPGSGSASAADPKGLKVMRVFDGSPADEAGIKVGDVFVAADGRTLAGISSDVASSRVKGPEGTAVRLTVERDGRPRTLKLTRRRVSVPVVEARMRRACGKKIGVVALSQFSSGAHAEVYACAAQAREAGRPGVRLRPARQRRRAGRRGAADRQRVPPGRADRHHPRAQRSREARSTRPASP